ncbi:MAG: peptidase S41, partial [Flavobacteriaceae bacterium]
MYKNLLVFFAVLISNISFAQNCSCSDSFFWLKVTMEKNDAGFQYAFDNKGQDYYLKHSQSFS